MTIEEQDEKVEVEETDLERRRGMKFIIYFDQINQTKFEIEADSKEKAINKAIREWNTTFRDPNPSHVETEK